MKYEGAALNSTLATLNHFSLFQKYLFKKSGLNTKESLIIKIGRNAGKLCVRLPLNQCAGQMGAGDKMESAANYN